MWRENYKVYPEIMVREYVDITPAGESAPSRVYLLNVTDNQARALLVQQSEVGIECQVTLYAYEGSGVAKFRTMKDQFESIDAARAYGSKVVEKEIEKFRYTAEEKAARASAKGAQLGQMSRDQLVKAGILNA